MPDHNCPIEASLSLQGKDYKWWMSLAKARQVTQLLKEYLFEKEEDRNWEEWDNCYMEQKNLNLTQYIACYYRQIVLKLKGIDNVQKVRGFIRGLKREYKMEVRSPKSQKT